MQLNRSFLNLFLLFFLSIFTCTYALGAGEKYSYSVSYFTGEKDPIKWSSITLPGYNMGYIVNQMSVDWSDGVIPKVVVGLDNGYVVYYNEKGKQWEYNTKSSVAKSSVAQISVDWSTSSAPRIVVGLENGKIDYYNGTEWRQLTNKSNGSDISSYVCQMSVDWYDKSSTPKIVIGLQNGRVLYFNGNDASQWWELHNDGWGSAVVQMSVDFSSQTSTYFPKVVVGLHNGSVQYFTGIDKSQWWELHNDDGHWVYQMSVDFSSQTYFPKVVVGLGDGSVQYFNGMYNILWSELHNDGWGSAVVQMSVDFSSQTYFPKVVVGLGDGAVQYFNGNDASQWWELHNDGWANVHQMSVDFSSQTSTYFPKVVVSLEDGAVQYFDGIYNSNIKWVQLHDHGSGGYNDSVLDQMSVDFSSQTSKSAPNYYPNVVLGFGSASAT